MIRWQRWRLIGTAAAVIGVASFIGGVYLAVGYDSTRPTEAVSQEGRTYPQDNHGHIVFLTEQEHWLTNSLMVGGGVGLIGGTILGSYAKRLRKKIAQASNIEKENA